MDLETSISKYFHQGVCYDDMLKLIFHQHYRELSIRTLQRILRKLGLKRKGYKVDSRILVRNIIDMLANGAENRGYRSISQRLIQRGLQVQSSLVQKALKIIDPEGCARRSRHRLKRRKYINRGPNDVWHVDENDKLKSFGFYIHGAIDGFSRKMLWLNVSSTNKDPEIVAHYFLNVVENEKKVPRRIRGDYLLRCCCIERFRQVSETIL